jgi:chorismate synthase
MPGNTFGHIFRVTTFGESHGIALGAVVDGCPSNIPLSEKDIQKELNRRRPGQSPITTARQEHDICDIVSGVFEGKTTGMPIAVLVRNTDQRSSDYDELCSSCRSGHADKVFRGKYGNTDYRGGGRSSGRETLGRVIGGAIAKKILPRTTRIIGHVIQIGDVHAQTFSRTTIEKNPVRCADAKAATRMEKLVLELQRSFDSVGAVVEIRITAPPKYMGEPVFDKLKADLAKAITSIGSVTGFCFGGGFDCAHLRGSEYICDKKYFGGILGGISTGEEITLHACIKPPVSVGHVAKNGRHDPCLAPRIIPVMESMVAITLADHYLRSKLYQ